MFEKLFSEIKPLDYNDLNGKMLRMIYVEKDGYGLLAGQDERKVVYILAQVKPD